MLTCRLGCLLTICSFLFACSNQPHTPDRVASLAYQQDLFSSIDTDKYLDNQDIESTLAQAARSIDHSLIKLAKIKQSESPQKHYPLQILNLDYFS